MREIKFRGFSKFKPQWWYGNLTYNRCTYEHEDDRVWIAAFARKQGNVNQFLNLCHFAEVDPESVGQYTGLKDKNGKEIYEGDIVHKDGWVAGCNHSVVFSGGRFVLNSIETGSHGDYIPTHAIEVIGNIYENPELLNPL